MTPAILCRLALCAAISASATLCLGAPLAPDAINGASYAADKDGIAVLIKTQVLLDRAGLSPGVIDGRVGENLGKALAAFQRRNGLAPSGTLDRETFAKLATTSNEPVLATYEISQKDVQGPFAKNIPASLEAMAKLPRLSYGGPREALAERFHMSEKLLVALNPQADFARAGTRITVANVGSRSGRAKVTNIVVDKQERSLSAFDREGNLVAFYPASIGSDDKPAPSGVFKIKSVEKNPTYHYDPRFAFKGVKTKRKFIIQPGPNSPVGAVWIELTAPSYGVHGTPFPEKVGKTESHGCIRLTNWDALDLASMVRPGTVVDFRG